MTTLLRGGNASAISGYLARVSRSRFGYIGMSGEAEPSLFSTFVQRQGQLLKRRSAEITPDRSIFSTVFFALPTVGFAHLGFSVRGQSLVEHLGLRVADGALRPKPERGNVMTYDPTKSMQSSQTPKTCVTPILFMLLCSSLAAFVTGCGTAAIITKKDGTMVEGTIRASDSDQIYLDTPERGGISRQSIKDIDHPGNVAATIGGVLAGYGIANIVIGAPQYCTGYQSSGAGCTGVFLPAVIGGSLLTYGLLTWSSSVDAAGKSEKSTARRLTVVPVASTDKTNQYYGASARISF